MFAIAREIPGKPEDTEWFSRPSEVSEALFQAASDVASDLGSDSFDASGLYVQYWKQEALQQSEKHLTKERILSRGHDTSKMEVSGGPLQTVKSNLDKTSEQLNFQEERNQEAPSAFGGKNADASESVAFQAVIASIEPFEKSTPGVFEPAASKSLLYKKDDGDSSLYWHPNLKSFLNAPQEIVIKPLSLIPEQTLGSSDIIYPMKVWTSDSLGLQDLKQQTFEEVADSSSCILGKNVNSSNITEGPSAAVGSSFSANLAVCDAQSQGALAVISDASSLIAVGQETLLKADVGQEGLQGKAESDIYTLDDDTECCSLDENAVECSKRVAGLQREICDQGDLRSECIELAGLETLLDDLEICDSSLHWQSTVQLPSKEESESEEPVDHSNVDINQSFSSVSPPFFPHKPTRELEYHSSDLRMLRVSPDTVPRTLKHLTGDTSKGGIAEIPQPNLKPGITTTPEDSDIGSHLFLSPEDFPRLAVRSPQVKTIGQYTDILNQQALADGHLIEETLKVSAVPELADQKTGIASVPFSSSSQRGKPSIFYPQALPDNHLTAEALKVSTVPGLGDQKTGIPTVPPNSYSLGEKYSIFYPQALPGSHQTEEALKVSVVPGSADQKTGIQTVPASSYSVGEKPGIFYQPALPGSYPSEEALKVSASPRPAEQKTGISTTSPTSYLHGEKPSIFYQKTLPESHLTKQALKVSAAPGPPEQKTGIPTVTSTSYAYREKPSILYQQELPDSHPIQQVKQDSAAPGPLEQKTGTSTVPSTSYAYREKPSILYQQELPDSHLIEQAQKVSAAPGFAEQKTGTSAVPSTSYSYREKPGILYQQELPDSHPIQQVQKASAAPGPLEQKTGTSTVPSTSYAYREKPSILYQQELPDSHPIQQVKQDSAAPGPLEQKTGTSTVPSTSYAYREKPSILYQQELPDSHLIEQAQKVSAAPGFAEQETGTSTVPSTSYSYREKPSILYQQEEKPSILYQQELPDSHLTKEAQRVPATPGLVDQDTGLQTVPSSSYAHREKPIIFYQQKLPGSHLTEEALKVSAVAGPADPKTGISESSRSYSHREKSSIFYQQELPDSHPTEEALKVSADQKTGISTVPSSSSSYREKPIISYQQEFPDLTQVALKVLEVPGPADQKIGIPAVTSTYSRGEKPIISYEQELPDSNEDALELLGVPGQADQNTAVPGPSDQKTGIRTSPSSSYSYREKPDGFYQQELPNLTEEALKVFALPGPADQNTEIPTGPSSSFSHKEKLKISTRVNPSIFFRQQLPDRRQSEDILKISPVPEPTDELPDQHQTEDVLKDLPERHLTEDDPKSSSSLGQADQITGLSTVPPDSYSYSEKHKLADSRIVINKPESSGFEDVGTEEIRGMDSGSKTLKEIRTLLMEAENIALRRYNFPVPLVPFRDPFTEESPNNKCTQKDISTQTNLKCQRGYSGTIGNKITSVTDSREEEGVLESDDGGGSSVDSLAAHVKNLLKCESSLNHAKQILRNAEEEESRVRARAWNLKFNMAHDCGYSISELNEDDRRKVEEIKAKLFGHGRTTDLSKVTGPMVDTNCCHIGMPKSSREIKAPVSSFSGKMSSDAVTQITTESPGKAIFSSEIFVNAKDRGHQIPETSTQKLGNVPVRFASSSSVQQITVSNGTNDQPSLLPYKPSGTMKMYYVPQLKEIPSLSLDSKSDTTIESSHSGSNDAIAPDFPAQVLGTRNDDLADTVNIKHKEGIYNAQVQVLITSDENLSEKNQEKEIYSKRVVTEAVPPEEESLQKNTTVSSDATVSELSAQLQDVKTGNIPDTKAIEQKEEIQSKRTVPKEAWPKDKQREHTCLPPPYQNVEKTKTDYTRVESLSINVNLENKEVKHTTKSQARDYPKSDKQVDDPKKDDKASPQLTTQHPTSESTQDESREEQDVKGWTGRQQQQKHKLQKKKRYKSLEKYHKNTDSRPSEESDLFTDTTTNILSTTTSPVESDILTQTDKELALHERSSSVSTIDTARLIHAFGHDRVCLSPRRTKLYSSITDHQRRYLEKQSKKYKKALNTRYPQITSEHTRRKHIQVTDHISSDSVSSSTSSFWNSTSTFCIKQNVHMLNKGVQAGNLEIVNGVRKHTRDVGMTFPTPSSSKTRVEEDSDVTSWSEEKIEEKKLLTNCIGDKKLRKNKQSCCEGVSWFVPVENVKSVPKKENLPMLHGPGVAWFAPITSTKPWREPLREQNWQGQPMDSPSSLAGLGREPPKPFVRVTLQESLHLHRPDFISRSGERIKRLKLIVQERKMQNMLQSERDALFNTGRGWQGCRGPVHPLLPKRGFLAAQKKRPIGKKEMIQRSKRIYEQLPEVQKKREEEKRRSEYKSYRLRAQLYKKSLTKALFPEDLHFSYGLAVSLCSFDPGRV
ncbi:hypothetical protein CB1_000252023 [Camelus ferus]|nr:hypothetical protein CB1_000252023 [Camelus ferus]